MISYPLKAICQYYAKISYINGKISNMESYIS